MIIILFHNVAIRMQMMFYARGCYNSDANCDFKFFSFPRNPQRWLWFSNYWCSCWDI